MDVRSGKRGSSEAVVAQDESEEGFHTHAVLAMPSAKQNHSTPEPPTHHEASVYCETQPAVPILNYMATQEPSPPPFMPPQPASTSHLESLFCQACKTNIATMICVQCLLPPYSGFKKFCESCSSKEHDRDFLSVKKHKPKKIGNVTASETYIGAYQEILATQDCVEMWFIKVILLGPPRLGKTTLRRRLTGKMKNISSSSDAEPSTGVIESKDNIFIRNISNTTAIVTSAAQWSATEDLESVISMFVQFIPSNIKARGASASKPESVPPPSRNTGQFEDVADLIRQAVNPEMWKSITKSCTDTAFLNMEDTGGQPEFMDLLPALTIGPALYLLFCNLADKHGLQSCYPVSFRDKSGKNIVSSLSAYTMQEVLLNALASISCFQSLHLDGMATLETSGSAVDDLLMSCNKCKSLAYIVGTHRDLVSEEQVAKFDEELQQSIRSTDFFEEGLVLYSSEDRMVLPIDNMNGGEDEIKSVQLLLEENMKKHFKKLKIPVSWLMLSLCLRKREQRTASLTSVLQLAHGLGISDERETKLALWFLHHYTGVLMYFPAVKELKDTVICDKQIVYDSATNLLLNTFKFRSVKKFVEENFRKTGQFSLKDIEEATSGVSGDYIPLPKLVRLLQHINILASIPQPVSPDGHCTEKFFMPSALKNATPQELSKWWESVSEEAEYSPAVLFIHYKCGFVPMGVFPALIAHLTQAAEIKHMHMIVDGIKKNLVQFHFSNDCDTITLVSQPKFYAVHISRQPTTTAPLHMVCTAVRDVLESSLKEVTNMNRSFSAELELAFECPSHPGRKHLCLVKCGHVQAWKEADLQEDYFSLSDHGLLAKELDWDSGGVDKDLNEIAYHMLDWEKSLSSHMGLTHVDIHDIKAMNSDPVLQRQEALRRWKNNQGLKLQATYGNLLQTFKKAGHRSCVEAVRRVLTRKCESTSEAKHGGSTGGVCWKGIPHKMLCLKNSDRPQPLEMEPRHLVWFGQPLHAEVKTRNHLEYCCNIVPHYLLLLGVVVVLVAVLFYCC